MKYLILFLLFSASIIAGEFPVSEGEVKKGDLAKTQLDKLSQLYSSLDAYCDNSGHHADLVAACKAQKLAIKDEYSSRFKLMISDGLEQGMSDEKNKLSEAKCVAAYRKLVTDAGGSYNGDENCSQLKYALEQLGN